jgi:hypothetical protein
MLHINHHFPSGAGKIRQLKADLASELNLTPPTTTENFEKTGGGRREREREAISVCKPRGSM